MRMTFENIAEKIDPKIKAIAARLDGKYTSFSEDDLYQEALLKLWKKYNENMLFDKTESYIAQGASFDMRNYIRTHFKGIDRRSVSVYEQVNEEGDCLIDFLPDKKTNTPKEVYDTGILLADIRDKLSARENIVLDKTADGLTTREIGGELGVSHVMVVKIKKKIRNKCVELGWWPFE